MGLTGVIVRVAIQLARAGPGSPSGTNDGPPTWTK
jgi:hypothetical protein